MTQVPQTQPGDVTSGSTDIVEEVVVASIADSAPSGRPTGQGKPDCDYPFNEQCLSKRDFIKEIQSKLIVLGCDIGSVDGIPGTKTLGAITQMQKTMNVALGIDETPDAWRAVFDLARRSKPGSCSCKDYQKYTKEKGCICANGYDRDKGKCRTQKQNQSINSSRDKVGKGRCSHLPTMKAAKYDPKTGLFSTCMTPAKCEFQKKFGNAICKY